MNATEAITTDVLVVGAGPTGLSMAADLARRGLRVMIIDKNPQRSDKSKALGVQAGTLESWQDSFGSEFTDRVVQAGNPARQVQIHIDDLSPISADLGSIPSQFNYILILEQSETERLLEEQLNKYSVEVERECAFVKLEQKDNGVVSKLRFKDRKVREVHSAFVIGCDGAHSEVRHCLDLTFFGASYNGDFILGDVEIEWPWDYDKLHVFVSSRGVMPCFPMKGTNKYRLIPVLRDLKESSKSEISLDEFHQIVQTLCSEPIKIKNCFWITRFKVHRRMTDHFQKGRVFLAGDAAHIHSPAGGQGMNTGIQDALNLSFKMQQVLKEGAPIQILEEYEKERMPIAKQVLQATDFAFQLALLRESFLTRFIRSKLVPIVVRSKFLQKKVIEAISEISVARKDISKRSPK